MNVDFIVDQDKYITGLSCYSSNLKEKLHSKVNLNEVETEKNIPKLLLLLGKFLPFDIKTVLRIYPLFLNTRKKSLVHFTSQNFVLPLFFKRCKSVVTVHDMILFELSRKKSLLDRIRIKLVLFALRKADKIIADSKHTKKRIIEMINYPAEKITVVPLGVDRKIFMPMKVKKDKFTILYVGSEMPRKNLGVLIKAFALLKKKIPSAKLVKIGKSQWPKSRERLKKLIYSLKIEDSVVFKDYVENLALEYSKATIFVFPSLYEGFGFPVLEAMACGCPVICSDKTSVPEVGGDAVQYFDGFDVEDLSEKMYNLLMNKKVQVKMRKKGLERAKEFTWKKTAEKTIKVYESLLRGILE